MTTFAQVSTALLTAGVRYAREMEGEYVAFVDFRDLEDAKDQDLVRFVLSQFIVETADRGLLIRR
jgi:hypothetical protein